MLVDTAGSPNSNTYISEANATTYLTNSRLFVSLWNDATTQNREKALIWATSMLDQLFDWAGSIRHVESVADGGQALRWPRSGVADPDGRAYDYDLIPQPLAHATAELAFLLIQKDRTQEVNALGQGFSSFKVDGVVSFTIDKNAVTPLIPRTIIGMLLPLGQINGDAGNFSGGARTVSLIRS